MGNVTVSVQIENLQDLNLANAGKIKNAPI